MNTFDESKIRRATDFKFAHKTHAEANIEFLPQKIDLAIEDKWDELQEEIDPDIYKLDDIHSEWVKDPTEENLGRLLNKYHIQRPPRTVALTPEAQNYEDFQGLYDSEDVFPTDFPENFNPAVDVPYRIEIKPIAGGWEVTRTIDGVIEPGYWGGSEPWEETVEYNGYKLAEILSIETHRAYNGEWTVDETLILEMQDKSANPHTT